MTELEKLLNAIKEIIDREKTLQEAKRARGENFNIFNVMGVSTSEVKLHSAFIAELLNPYGNHGLGEKFLKIFIDEISNKSVGDDSKRGFIFDTLSIKNVIVEKDIGPIKGDHGGRIDICIEDNNGCYVIIENKIYAGDQDNQMKRYWNYAQEKCKSDKNRYRLVYLTLDGHEPSEGSLCGLKSDDYICLSYKYDIISWLNQCVGLSVRHPLVRETIIQYIETLKQLTYSDMNDMDNQNDVLEIMSKKEYLDTLFVIANNLNGVICNIINKTLRPQLMSLAKTKGLELSFVENNGWMTDSYAGWSFCHPEWKNFYIQMEFEKRGLSNLIIGFHKKDNKKREDIKCWDELWGRVTSKDKINQNWIWRDFYPSNWNTPDSLKDIIDGKMIERISEEIGKLIECTQGLDV